MTTFMRPLPHDWYNASTWAAGLVTGYPVEHNVLNEACRRGLMERHELGNAARIIEGRLEEAREFLMAHDAADRLTDRPAYQADDEFYGDGLEGRPYYDLHPPEDIPPFEDES